MPRRRRIDADRIATRLYQGGRPPLGPVLRDRGFNMVVLSAQEYQPSAHLFDGVTVIRAPLDDHMHPLTWDEISLLCHASEAVAKGLEQGQKVLVTCWSGLNRSGLISALSLIKAAGISPQEAVQQIQSKRSWALSNSSFVRQISEVAFLCFQRFD